MKFKIVAYNLKDETRMEYYIKGTKENADLLFKRLVGMGLVPIITRVY